MSPAAKQRRDGEGSVYKRINNGREVWTASATYWEDGRRKFITGTGATPAQALERRTANWKRLIDGGGRKASRRRLREALDAWEEANDSVAENKKRTRRAVEQHIISRIGNKRISEITSKELQKLFEGLEASPQKSVARNAYRSLSAVLEHARRQGWISRNPLKSVPAPKYVPAVEKDDERRATDRSEAYVELLAYVKEHHPQDYPWLLFMSLGIRIGELCGLELSSIKHGRNDHLEIVIDRTFLTVPSRIGKRVKGKKERSIVLPAEYMAALIQWEFERPNSDQVEEWAKEQLFIYTDKTGRVRGRTTNRTRTDWDDLLFEYLKTKRKNLTRKEFLENYRFRPHFVRHITASNLAAAGIPIQTAQSILGHFSPEMTEHYTHTLEKAKEEGTEAIAEAIFGE